MVQANSNSISAAFKPLYKQIKDLLIQRLQSGEWKPGEPIPSELELCSLFGVSQGTVRKAIDELAAASVLIRRQGKGTYVATHHEAQVRHRFLRFTHKDTIRDEALRPIQTSSRYLSCTQGKPQDFELPILPMSQAELLTELIAIKRVIEFNGVPTVFEHIYLPAAIFKGLTLERLQELRGPLYVFFESQYGVSMLKADEHLTAVAASSEAAQVLQIEKGAPLLQVDRISYTYNGKPIEFRRGLYLTDHYVYRNGLN
ncbi:GntR family transcriptional regulator [Brackiella oedipodis]|uniref:GntR family transcriptional regulator n=1 Tax=Brackiella oedipodis TaxID=124225 RepID=UPI00048D0FB7|nr:GntR family transcriptional regulator [Brackiella oedipodis]